MDSRLGKSYTGLLTALKRENYGIEIIRGISPMLRNLAHNRAPTFPSTLQRYAEEHGLQR